MVTPAFRCHTGVKQGCMLSPTLFNLYLSDLSEKLKAKNLNDVELNALPLSCMLYADDQPRPQGFSLKWVGHFLREKPWGRGCADDLVIFSKSKNACCRIIWIPSVNTAKKTTCRLTLIKLRC